MSRVVVSFGTSRLFAKDEWGSVGELATTDWFKIGTGSRRLFVAASLFATYVSFGTIVWATYLTLESSPHRAVPITPEPLTPEARALEPETLALEKAWHRWLRHQSDFKKRIEAITRAQSSRPSETLPADRSDLSSRASNSALAPQPPAPTATPSLKPVDASALHALAGTVHVPALKPAGPLQQVRYLPAMERTREEGEPGSFWSGRATLFEPSSADPIDRDADRWGDDSRASPGGDRFTEGESSSERSAAGNVSSGEARTGAATERAGSGERDSGGTRGDTQDQSADDQSGDSQGSAAATSNDRRAGRSGRAERDRGAGGDRSSHRSDVGRSNTHDGRASRQNSARSDRNRGRGNDRGFGNDRGRGSDRGRGAGGRGGRGDHGGRGRGRR